LISINFILKLLLIVQIGLPVAHLNTFSLESLPFHDFDGITSLLSRSLWPLLHTQEEHFFISHSFNLFSSQDTSHSLLNVTARIRLNIFTVFLTDDTFTHLPDSFSFGDLLL